MRILCRERSMSKALARNPIQYSILISLLIHGMVTFVLTLSRLANHSPTQKTTIHLELVDEAPKTKRNPEKDSFKKKTIVDQDKINNEVDPMAQYLSSHNQKVLKETVAQEHGKFQNLKQQKTMIKGSEQQEKVAQKRKLANPKMAPLKQDLFGSYKQSLEKVMQKQAERQAQKKSQGGDSSNADSSQTRDYLPGKEAGLETLLSTREFVYYTYYNRIRNQLSEYWEPKIKEKIVAMFKQGRRIASTEDHITKLQIILDGKGLLVKVQVLGASGVRDLDDVAVEAFKAAAPFPNPPKGIIESDGTVKIQWDFVVES